MGKNGAQNIAATKSWILAPSKRVGNNDNNGDASNDAKTKDKLNNSDVNKDEEWTNAAVNVGLINNRRQRLFVQDLPSHTQFGANRPSILYERLFRPLWLGLGLFLVLCAFWILDSLKDPILGVLTNSNLQIHQPRAKLLSVCATLALVCFLEYVMAQRKNYEQQQMHESPLSNTDRDDDKDDSMANKESVMEKINADILDDSKGWTKMSFNDDHQRQTSTVNQERVPSSIFAYIAIPYCVTFSVIAYLLQFHPDMGRTSVDSVSSHAKSTGQYPNTENSDKVTFWYFVGYAFYAAVESFGSLAVATFWSYANSTLCLDDAERYYGPIIALAQLGAIVGSTMVATHWWSSVTLVILACLIIVLHLIVMHLYTLRFLPTREYDDEEIEVVRHQEEIAPPVQQTHQLAAPVSHLDPIDTLFSDTSTNNTTIPDRYRPPSHQQPSWLSGVYLILQHNYVLYILGVSCLYEISTTCLNYQMTLLGWNKYASAPQSEHKNMNFTQFMGRYGQLVNMTSLLLSSFAFPFMIRRFGLKYTLRIFPVLLFVVNIIAFGAVPGNLTVLFISLSILKAMTYSIHDPAKELLYVPTSPRIQFQAKFWIDVVGARIAKAMGSSLNNFAGSVDRSIRVASAPSLLTSILLCVVCYKVGQRFEQLVEQKKIVGIHPMDDHGDVWILPPDDDDDEDGTEIVVYDTAAVGEGGDENDENKTKQSVQTQQDDDNLEEGDDKVFESPNSIIEMPSR